tara:strand:- start:157 stop:1824 length:1668 start_codon:yes stop_codon:yes gene_type:complete
MATLNQQLLKQQIYDWNEFSKKSLTSILTNWEIEVNSYHSKGDWRPTWKKSELIHYMNVNRVFIPGSQGLPTPGNLCCSDDNPTCEQQSEAPDILVTQVQKGTDDWEKVRRMLFADDFSESTRTLVSVQRIQNRPLLKRYRAEKDIITSSRGEANLNERCMFFGSRTISPLEIATSPEGFMVEAGRSNTFYGQGTYFADKARYSHHYAHKTPSTDGTTIHRQLLLVNVLCGVSKEYSGSTTDSKMGRTVLPRQFDSVRGGPHRPLYAGPGKDDSKMSVVYKSSQTLPQFLVTYSDAEDNYGSGSGNGGSIGGSSSGLLPNQCGCGRSFKTARGLKQHQRKCSQTVSAAMTPGFTLSGLPLGHPASCCMGRYTMLGWTVNGKPVYKGGRQGNRWMSYSTRDERWYIVKSESAVCKGAGIMYLEGSNGATPDEVTATWMVPEGFKHNSALTVTAMADGNSICVAGLATGHRRALYMGEYARQTDLKGGRPWYKNEGNSTCIWYHALHEDWNISAEKYIGKVNVSIYSKSNAASPDAVPADQWLVSEGFQPNSAVRCT